MSKLDTAARAKMDLADFGQPSNRAFPIKDQSDVHDAASLIGKAKNPTATKARIIRIAKRKGFDIPESWKNSEAEALAMADDDPRLFDEPGGDALHVDAPIGKVPPVGPSRHFLTRFMSRVRQKAAESGNLTPEDIRDAVRHARGHAGGTAAAAARSAGSRSSPRVTFEPWQMEPVIPMPEVDDDDDEDLEEEALIEGPRLAKADPAANYREADTANQDCGSCRFYVPDWDLDGDPQCRLVEGLIEPTYVCDLFRPPVDLGYAARTAAEDPGDVNLVDLCRSDEGAPGYRLFLELSSTATANPPEWINFLPIPGTYTHQRWGPVAITPARNAQFVDNFNRAVYQDRLPVDAEHETKLSGAVSWIRGLRQNSDGSVDARMEWTPRGRQFLAQGAFRYVSPEWYDTWTDPATGQAHSDVLIGGALTTRPFFKERSLRPLIANELGLSVLRGPIDSAVIDNSETLVFTTLKRRDLPMPDKKPDDNAAVQASDHANEEPRTPAPATDKAATVTMSEEDYRAFTEMRSQMTELRTANEAKDAELRRASEAIATMQSDERTRRFTEEIAGRSPANGAPYSGDHTKALGVMTALATQFGEDSDVFKDYVSGQRAAAAQLKDSAVFKEIGKSGSQSFTETSPLGRIDALAQQYREDHPDVTIERARTMVMAEHPELYDEFKNQRPRV